MIVFPSLFVFHRLQLSVLPVHGVELAVAQDRVVDLLVGVFRQMFMYLGNREIL